MGQSL